MKTILRHFFHNTLSLYFVTQIAGGLVFSNGSETFIKTAVVLTLVAFLGKPVISLLLLPLNLITFGIFRWVSSAVALYIVTLIIPEFKIIGFNFAGFASKWIDLPSLNFSGIVSYIAFSFLLSVILSLLHWLSK